MYHMREKGVTDDYVYKFMQKLENVVSPPSNGKYSQEVRSLMKDELFGIWTDEALTNKQKFLKLVRWAADNLE